MYSKASVGVDKVELQARIYGQPDVLTPNKPPSLRAVRKAPPSQFTRPMTLQHRLEPLPSLLAYQKRKNEEVLKFDKDQVDTSNQPLPKHTRRDDSTPSLPELNTQPLSTLRVSPRSSRLTESVKKRQSLSRKTNQSALYVNTDPDMVITKYSPPLEDLTDPLEIVARLKREPHLGFIYLTPVGNSVHYNPYKLRYIIL